MKDLSYNIFRERLHKKAEDKRIPLRVCFELTYACNFNCLHCYIPSSNRRQKTEDRRRRELNTKQIFSILDQLKELGCFHLGFTGGEVFLRKDIFDILWYAKRNGFNLIILTNGSFINKAKADELKKLHVNKVDVTLHSMNKANFESITRSRNSYKKVLQAIRLLHKRRVPLGIKNCAMKENTGDLPAVEEFSHKLGALTRVGSGVVPRLDRSKLPLKHRVCTPDIDFSLKGEFNLYCPVVKGKEKRRVFQCGVGTQSLTINPKGEIKLCPQIDYPKLSIIKYGLDKAWRLLGGVVGNIEREGNLDCNRCRLEKYCNWCAARSWLEDGRFTTCDAISRSEALARLRQYKQAEVRGRQ